MTAQLPAELSRAALYMRRLVDVHGAGARDVLEGMLARFTTEELAALRYHWSVWARPKQLLPDGNWRVALILAGRAWGKTRAVNEYLLERIMSGHTQRFLLIGRTDDDAEKVLVRGKDSGLVAISPPWFKARPFKGDPKRVEFPNGAVGYLASAEKPDSVRGENLDDVIWDEFAAAKPALAAEVYYNAKMALRGSERARLIMATTSRKKRPLLRELRDKARENPDEYLIVQGATLENRGNLPADYVAGLISDYAGTRLWHQELEGAVLDDEELEGVLWKADWIKRADVAPKLERVVVGVDPAVSVERGSDSTGIVVAGIDGAGNVYVLADITSKYSADRWPKEVVRVAKKYRAVSVVVETNRGGNLAPQAVLEARDREDLTFAVEGVWAHENKESRADPVARYYERGRVFHVGHELGLLEDQLVTWDPRESKSPDRIDALVWAVWKLAERQLKTTDFKAVARANAGTAAAARVGSSHSFGGAIAYGSGYGGGRGAGGRTL